MFQNVVIGKPIVPEWALLSKSEEEFIRDDLAQTLHTDERFLPRIMVAAGIVSSVSEVKRNQPQLMKSLDCLDCLEIKWGKKRLFVVVGE